MNTKILVLGSDGLVGSRFTELFPTKDRLITPSIGECDLTDKSITRKFILSLRPDTIVNFSAYTDVTKAEDEKENIQGLCWQLNVDGIEILKDISDEIGSHLIHISTDMVFPGNEEFKGPYDEGAKPKLESNILTWYGFTKAKGEAFIDPKNDSLIRINYPVRAHYDLKSDYFRKPLSLFDANKLYPLFCDQQITITFIDDFCVALDNIINKEERGIFHVASEITTPYDVISLLIKKARKYGGTLEKSSITTINNPVRYPMWGGLESTITQKRLGIKFKSTSEIIDCLIEQGI